MKFLQEDDQSHKITLFVNTAIYNLYLGGVSDPTISETVDQMLKTVTMFGSHESGWVTDEISRVNIFLVKLSPIRAGSYIPLLPNWKKQQRNVMKVDKTSDHSCYLFCYYAAYHAQPGKPPLYQPDSKWRKKAQISTYRQNLQPNLGEINGDY